MFSPQSGESGLALTVLVWQLQLILSSDVKNPFSLIYLCSQTNWTLNGRRSNLIKYIFWKLMFCFQVSVIQESLRGLIKLFSWHPSHSENKTRKWWQSSTAWGLDTRCSLLIPKNNFKKRDLVSKLTNRRQYICLPAISAKYELCK